MDFELTEEQKLLKDSAAQFTKSSPVARFRKLRSHSEHGSDALGWDRGVWKQMAELGWLGLWLPESAGGLGMSFFDFTLILEELGKTLVPEPLVASCVLAASVVVDTGSAAQQKRLLEPMTEGKTSLALAWAEREGRYDASAVATTATPDGDGFVLAGEKVWVLNGHAADWLVVTARTAEGVGVFAVAKDAAGLTITPAKTMDGGWAARVRLDGVKVAAENVLTTSGLSAVEKALDLGAAAACAEGYGIANTVLWMTVNYLNVRKQFNVAIGSFQALQHRAVDMFVETELLRSTSILASVKATDADENERKRAVSIAKAQLALGGKFVVQQAIQLHGGIGVTDEHDVGLYFKRMSVLHALFGDEEHHLARFASLPTFTAQLG